MPYIRYNNSNIEIVNAAGNKIIDNSAKVDGKAYAKIAKVDVKSLVSGRMRKYTGAHLCAGQRSCCQGTGGISAIDGSG